MKKIINLFILAALTSAPACLAGKLDEAQSKVTLLSEQISSKQELIDIYSRTISRCTVSKDPAGYQCVNYKYDDGDIITYPYSTLESWKAVVKTAQEDLEPLKKELPKAQNYLDYQKDGLSFSLIKNTIKIYPEQSKGAAAGILGVVGLAYLASKKLHRTVDSETEINQTTQVTEQA